MKSIRVSGKSTPVRYRLGCEHLRSRSAVLLITLITGLAVACHPVQRSTSHPGNLDSSDAEVGNVDSASPDGGTPHHVKTPPPQHAASQPLHWIIADIKKPLHGLEAMNGPVFTGKEAITDSNYQQILDGLRANLHCNGIRIYIDPNIKDPTAYPSIYREVVDYARDHKLALYANPIETVDLRKEAFGNNKTAFAQWVVKYANYYKPEFLGPFNESGWDPRDMIEIVHMIRRHLDYPAKLVGPDMMHVGKTVEALERHEELIYTFDIISSHNAGDDETSNTVSWAELHNLAGKSTWSSENPRPYSLRNGAGQEIGIQSVIESNAIQGLVLYAAYPACVNADGSLTEKGREIAQALEKKK